MISSEILSGFLGVAQVPNAFKESQCSRGWGSSPHPWPGGSKLPCPSKFCPKSTRRPASSHRLGAHPVSTVNERSRVVDFILHPFLWFLYTAGPLCPWVPHRHIQKYSEKYVADVFYAVRSMMIVSVLKMHSLFSCHCSLNNME